jgi:uncharacterized protein
MLRISLAAGIALLLCCRICRAIEFPEPVGHVNDFAQVLDARVEERLESFLVEVAARYQVEVALLTMVDLGGEDPTEYANRIFESWGIGSAETDRGLLLLDAKQERFVRVEVGYGLEGVLNDGKVGAILDDEVIPHLKAGRSDLAYTAGLRALLIPVLEEEGRSAAELDTLLAMSGNRYVSPPASRRTPGIPWPIIALILFFVIFGGRRGIWLGGFGGFGGGGFGGGFGGGGGGFGGFGGGSSGGGGAGRGY